MARIPLPDGDGTERSRLWQLAPAFVAPVAALNHAAYEGSTLPARLRELVRFRVAVRNGCPV
jgi:alkylhydroperoxidase family enzyme